MTDEEIREWLPFERLMAAARQEFANSTGEEDPAVFLSSLVNDDEALSCVDAVIDIAARAAYPFEPGRTDSNADERRRLADAIHRAHRTELEALRRP